MTYLLYNGYQNFTKIIQSKVHFRFYTCSKKELYIAMTVLRSKNKDWLVRNQDNVSEWSDMSTADCCFSELAL